MSYSAHPSTLSTSLSSTTSVVRPVSAITPTSPAHFVKPDRVDPIAPGDRLPAEVYGVALDHLVVACVDLVLTQQQQVLITKRKRPPKDSWWIVGGRMIAGEHPIVSAQRKAAEEANLPNLDASRFHYVGVYSTAFTRRHQPPTHHGIHTLNLTYHVELTIDEKAQLMLCNPEYETWRWLDWEQILLLLNDTNVMDQALLQVLQDLRPLLNAQEHSIATDIS